MINLLPLLPGILAPVIDNYLIRKEKKDGPLWMRIIFVAIFSVSLIDGTGFTITWANLCLATIPFCFFDPLLSWLRGKRGLDYAGKTKNWDKWYTKFNPKVVMAVRILCAAILLGLFLWLK